ncbi:Bax inhibitor-1 family protein [Engelhardtia mirabilis]|uniref:Inhibitor of apoptosis-promoting Bax1 n=1 Tax=Engelhardtia mirabilis TaxID=2528011 RepID=A0A518BGH3_9BACT|nr:Inhibitor of apoptosis-promoting Bax1 [Planctomycetes bacterium Pla133]QDV00398.1 Inhibitor of apoptosis-promoting Bax1 [Planctomycetes bacterium Pla86]
MSDAYVSTFDRPIIEQSEQVRARFIVRTYGHLFGAIAAFVLIEVGLFQSGMARQIAEAMLGTSWLLVLGAFMVVSWLASRFAGTSNSMPVQYAALGGFVLAEALIFVPLLYIADATAPGVIASAAVVTLAGFGGLTTIVFWTRKDFSFMGAAIKFAMVGALLAILGGALFGFHLGTWFSVGMVVVAGMAILHDTSNVLHHFPANRHVAASLQLFASVALMFWYVLRLFMSSRD